MVLEAMTLPNFIQYITAQHCGVSTVVVCSGREAFFEHFLDARNSFVCDYGQSDQEISALLPTAAVRNGSPVPWSTPSLRQLGTIKDIRMVFCPDITHLRAYLATYSTRDRKETDQMHETGRQRILAILNPISLHRPTSAFSAQGLNRTLAIAVEAAHHTHSQLLLAECPVPVLTSEDPLMPDEPDVPARNQPTEDPWDQEVSILNVTTKSFGAGERGWVGRTVKLRTVAERWCTFESINSS